MAEKHSGCHVSSALQFKPMPSRLEEVLGGGREDLFWPNVPGRLDPCVCSSGLCRYDALVGRH